MYRSAQPRDEAFQDKHVSNLIEILTTKKGAIEEFRSKYEVGINCVAYYVNVNSGFHLSSELIKACADLSLSIDFDLYTY